jgi:hypothetical protein
MIESFIADYFFSSVAPIKDSPKQAVSLRAMNLRVSSSYLIVYSLLLGLAFFWYSELIILYLLFSLYASIRLLLLFSKF